MFKMTTKGGIAVAAAALLAGSASADISSVVFSITATLDNGNGPSYPLNIELDPSGVDANGDYQWTLANPIDVDDGNGQNVFTLDSAGITIIADPVIDLNFNVIAGMANTVFSVDSAVLSFAPLGSTIGRATAAVSVTDLNGDGASFTPVGGGAYGAFYNGGGTLFQELISSTVTADPFSTATANDVFPAVGYQSIGTTLTDIQSEWNFTLSAGDVASGTSSFEVIPAPASAVLGLAALAGLRRRR
ncbi:MAG: hypothetical protein Phyf2KO_12600 [Phycisphaerales bacterium]